MSQFSEYDEKDLENFLEAYEQDQSDEQTQSLKKLLSVQSRISIFNGIDPEEIKTIVYNLKFARFKFKDYVIEENDTSEEIFYIIDGECQVFHHKSKVGSLKAGEIFGEVAAIFSKPRNASVVCSSKTATLLSFAIDNNNMEFCANGLAILYRNLAQEINSKLEVLNDAFSNKH